MGHVVDTPPRAKLAMGAASGKKPFSIFIVNLLKQEAITQEMAETLYRLPTPPLQFQAMMRLRQQPGKRLDVLVQEMLATPEEPTWERKEKRTAWNKRRWFNKHFVSKTIFLFGLLLMGYAFWTKLWVSKTQVAQPPLRPADEAPILYGPFPAPVIKSPPAAARPAVPAPASQTPQHLSVHWQSHGMAHLTWDSAKPGNQYRLYSASSADFHDPQLLQQDSIPMTWWDWMPPEGPATLWVAATQILPSSRESPFSQPVQINIP